MKIFCDIRIIVEESFFYKQNLSNILYVSSQDIR